MARPYTQPTRENLFPFFMIEIKSEATGSTLYVAENQAATSGCRLLLTRARRHLCAEEAESFRDALRVFPTKAAVMEYNTSCLKASRRPAAKSASTDEAENLPAENQVTGGAKVMLTQNHHR